MKKVFLVIFSVLFGSSFSSFNLPNEKDYKLMAVWVFSDYEDEIIKYVKSESFKKDESGIEFKKNGKLTKRQNVGSCGTPPITYGNYKGSWKYTSDSTLTIKYNYWGGKSEQDWEIIELNSNSLKIRRGGYRTDEKKET